MDLDFSPLSRPNILLIITDDQPFYTLENMPKTRAAFSAGLEFSRAYVSIPVCGPSRVSVMTGLYMHNHRILENESTTRIFKEKGYHKASLGYRLSEAGYTCGYFGKYLNDYEERPLHVAPGYDYWGATFFNRDPMRANVQGRLRTPKYDSGAPVRAYEETTWTGDKAKRFIELNQQPWFCVASFQGPHAPFNVSLANRNTYANQTMPLRESFDHYDPNKPPWVRRDPLTTQEKADFQTEWRGKMGEILDVDDAVANIASSVDFDNTYVFFISDNGFMLGEHRLHAKLAPYEEATRSPLLVRGPSVRSGTDDRLVSLTDLAPTCYEIAGLEDEADSCDGRSMAGALMGAGVPKRDFLLMEQAAAVYGPGVGEVGGWRAIRSDQYLYVEHNTGERELYDMQADPYQKQNLLPVGELATARAANDTSYLAQKLTALKGASGEELRQQEYLD